MLTTSTRTLLEKTLLTFIILDIQHGFKPMMKLLTLKVSTLISILKEPMLKYTIQHRFFKNRCCIVKNKPTKVKYAKPTSVLRKTNVSKNNIDVIQQQKPH